MELDERKTSLTAHEAVLVHVPSEHQGVADALRVAFVPVKNNLPQDLVELLSQLH